MYYFMDSRPKFTGLVSLNVGGIARGHMSFRFWISCVVPKIFAIKVGSCVKLALILHGFGPQNFLGEGPPNFWTSQCSTLVRNTVVRATFKVNGKPPILGSCSPLTS